MPGDRRTPTVRLRRLAAELRSLRTSSGLTRDETVKRTGINVATLYRIEHARVRPQTRTLRTLLDLYGVEYTTYIGFEGKARGVWNYESPFVPGLLQTEDYARAVIRGGYPSASRDEVERRVRVRMERQNVLRAESPLELWGPSRCAIPRTRPARGWSSPARPGWPCRGREARTARARAKVAEGPPGPGREVLTVGGWLLKMV